MKKTFIFSFIIIFYSIILVGQAKPYKEVKFKNLNPVWLYAPIDSSLIGDGHYTGRNHFYGLHDTPYPYLKDDHYLYIAYHTTYSSGEIEGALLEKINLNDGKVVWQQKWDLRNNDRQEWVESIYIGDDGYLNVVTDRRIHEPFNDNYDLFTGVGDSCLIKIRKFDINDGTLMKTIGGSADDVESLRIKNRWDNRTILFPADGHYQYYDMTDSYETIFLYNIDEYGHLLSDMLIDTVRFDEDVDIHGEGMQFYRKMYKVNQDTLVSLAILYNRLYSDIDTQTIISVLNKDMKVIKRFRIDSLLPYNYKKLYLNYADDKHILVYGKKQNKSFRDTFFYVFFNYNGEIAWKFDPIYKNKNHLFSSFQYLDDEDEYLMPTYSSHYYGLDFAKTTIYDSVEQVKEFYYDNKDYGFFPEFMFRFDNGDMFLYGSTSYFDEDLSIFVYLCPTMMRIKAEDLGLQGTATKEILADIKNISISPNPAKSSLNLDFDDVFSGNIKIIDALGRVVVNKVIRNTTMQNIDISALSAGIYFVKAIDMLGQKEYKTGRFVKE